MKTVLKTLLIILFINSIYLKDGYGQDYNNPDLSFWSVGSGNSILKRFGQNYYSYYDILLENKSECDQVLLNLASKPIPKKKLFNRLGMSKVKFELIIKNLISANLIIENESTLATTIPVITDSQMKIIKEDLKEIAAKVAEDISKDVPLIRSKYEKSMKTDSPTWDQISHLLIDKFIVDGPFHSGLGALEREYNIKDYYDSYQKTIPIFFLERGKNYSTFGCNWYSYKDESRIREMYVLHGGVLNRLDIKYNSYARDSLVSSIILRLPETSNIKILSVEEISILDELGWLRNDSLLIPLIEGQVIKDLFPDFRRVGERASKIVFDDFSIILQSFENSPYSIFLEGKGDYIQVCYHILFGSIIEQLIKHGVLIEIPVPLPDYFGMYITIGSAF